jgi:hypothetical protein
LSYVDASPTLQMAKELLYLYDIVCVDRNNILQSLLPTDGLPKEEMEAIGPLLAYLFVTPSKASVSKPSLAVSSIQRCRGSSLTHTLHFSIIFLDLFRLLITFSLEIL